MDSMRKGADWERQAAKPKKTHEREIFGLALWKQTEEWRGYTGCAKAVSNPEVRPSRVQVAGNAGFTTTWTQGCTGILGDISNLYLILPLSSVTLLNIMGNTLRSCRMPKATGSIPIWAIKKKKANSCRDILNIKAIHITLSTWDHNHKHFIKGYLNALCILFLYTLALLCRQ